MLKRLNAYMFSDEWIQTGREFIATGRVVYPPHLIYPSDREEFYKRYEGFALTDNGLTFDGRAVVPSNQIDITLTNLYKPLGDIG